MKKPKISVTTITFAAMMAAMVYVVTLFRFPLLGSKVHFANAVCLLSGLLLGPVTGGVAAGLGSALYDATAGGYDVINVLITFVSKFAMAFVAGLLSEDMPDQGKKREGFIEAVDKSLVSCVLGALTYVALYMLKTYIYNRFVYGYELTAVWVTMYGKLIPSLINAVVAMVAAPIFYHAVAPVLRANGLLRRMRGD